MKKIERLLKMADKIRPPEQEQFDYDKLSTEELKELLREDITEERIMEILEPVRRW